MRAVVKTASCQRIPDIHIHFGLKLLGDIVGMFKILIVYDVSHTRLLKQCMKTLMLRGMYSRSWMTSVSQRHCYVLTPRH